MFHIKAGRVNVVNENDGVISWCKVKMRYREIIQLVTLSTERWFCANFNKQAKLTKPVSVWHRISFSPEHAECRSPKEHVIVPCCCRYRENWPELLDNKMIADEDDNEIAFQCGQLEVIFIWSGERTWTWSKNLQANWKVYDPGEISLPNSWVIFFSLESDVQVSQIWFMVREEILVNG